MWNMNIYSNIILKQKYIGTSIKVGCVTRSLYKPVKSLNTRPIVKTFSLLDARLRHFRARQYKIRFTFELYSKIFISTSVKNGYVS